MKRERNKACNNSQKQYNIRILFLVMISSLVISLCNTTTTIIHRLFHSSHTLSHRSSFYTYTLGYIESLATLVLFSRAHTIQAQTFHRLLPPLRGIILRSAVNSYTSKRIIYFCKWQRRILAHSIISSLIFLMSRIFVCIILAINAFIAHFRPAKKNDKNVRDLNRKSRHKNCYCIFLHPSIESLRLRTLICHSLPSLIGSLIDTQCYLMNEKQGAFIVDTIADQGKEYSIDLITDTVASTWLSWDLNHRLRILVNLWSLTKSLSFFQSLLFFNSNF